MKFQTFIAAVASVGVVATAAFVGGVGADVGVPSTGDIVSSAEDTTPGETPEQTATPTAPPDQTPTEEPSSESDSTDTESSSETESTETDSTDSESTNDESTDSESSETESTDDESTVNSSDTASAESESSANATVENNTAPVAAASAEEMVHERTRIELDATDSRDPDGDELNYTWTQVSGPDAELLGNNTSTTTFVSPDVALWTDVTFRVTVTDETGATDTANVTITVRSADYPDDTADSEEENDSDGETESDETNASDSTDSTDAAASGELTRDELSQAVFDSDFDALGTDEAVFVEELYLRQPSGEWDATEVRSREDIAQDRYNESFDDLGFDARVDVQETFDAQFGDTGENAAYSHDELSQAEWGYNFSELSPESAGHIAEMYDRQPFAEDQELEHIRTRDQFAYYLYDETELANLTREQRLNVERHYHAQFDD